MESESAVFLLVPVHLNIGCKHILYEEYGSDDTAHKSQTSGLIWREKSHDGWRQWFKKVYSILVRGLIHLLSLRLTDWKDKVNMYNAWTIQTIRNLLKVKEQRCV